MVLIQRRWSLIMWLLSRNKAFRNIVSLKSAGKALFCYFKSDGAPPLDQHSFQAYYEVICKFADREH